MRCELPDCKTPYINVRLVQYFHPDESGTPVLRAHYYCGFHASMIESGH